MSIMSMLTLVLSQNKVLSHSVIDLLKKNSFIFRIVGLSSEVLTPASKKKIGTTIMIFHCSV